jgi:hypothetical protein
MKLIIESWRKFVNEEKTTIKKLRIFDFDETIAFTQSSVKVVTATGGRLTLPSQEEFDRFVASEMSRLAQKGHRFEFDPIPALIDLGYEFDFSDFSQVRDPRENEQVTKIIRDVVEANKTDPSREVYVMTARSDDSRGSIKKYLSSLGFGPDDFTDVITLTGGSKREAIANIIEKHKGENGHTTIESVHFFDDSEKNLKDVALLRNDYPYIKDIRIKHVIEDKIMSLEEGEVVQGPWKSRLDTAIDELLNKFKIDPEDPDEESAFTREEIRNLIDALEERGFSDALSHVFGPTLDAETIMDIFPWYKKWFSKVGVILK